MPTLLKITQKYVNLKFDSGFKIKDDPYSDAYDYICIQGRQDASFLTKLDAHVVELFDATIIINDSVGRRFGFYAWTLKLNGANNFSAHVVSKKTNDSSLMVMITPSLIEGPGHLQIESYGADQIGYSN